MNEKPARGTAVVKLEYGSWAVNRTTGASSAAPALSPISPSVMDPSIAIVGCIAGVALVWKCLTF